MSDRTLKQLHDCEVEDRRRTTFHVVAFGAAILVVLATLVVALKWIALTI